MTKSQQPLEVTEDAETGNRFVAYSTRDGVQLNCMFDDEQPWFTERDLADIFGVKRNTVNEHIQKFRDAGELDESTCRDFRQVRQEGVRTVERPITHYSLDVAFYVGYRVNSTEGKLFRRWATNMLVQIATKGFVVNKRMLQDGKHTDRIRELREIIQDLRSTEANLYAELRTICAMCQDYDPASDAARKFYQNMQAKIFYAVTSQTPAQLIAARADANAPNMGLQTWTGDRILQSDATVGKNYLAEREVKELNRLTSILLDVFEDQLDVGRLVLMDQCTQLLDAQLKQLNRSVLDRPGPPKRTVADHHAKEQYKIFDERRRETLKSEVESDFVALKKASRELPQTKKPKELKKPKKRA